ncbi:hypothetical protein G4Z16_15380 [Streptomyces bathyalis]|uniref:Uncharacterized protein n=1 Tax=Streptomyces bathyalis TaxID=2710756 RepID=A0A7T1WSV5_9ACTN|nr:hypothetical protein [Streptomyces bathyalis]QPP07542.1 hypothetical protein G4Z16_15380 [Streptomyces bathyalis]
MDWGDVPAWAALVLSGVAVAVSWKARSDGKRSADAAQSSAASAAGSLALQQEEAHVRRVAARQSHMRLEHIEDRWLRLRNVGREVASCVIVVEEFEGLRDGFDLEPGRSLDFELPETARPEICVTWEEADGEFVYLPVPPKE